MKRRLLGGEGSGTSMEGQAKSIIAIATRRREGGHEKELEKQ